MTSNRVLRIARREVGYKESPPGSNRTKYGKWYPMDGQPWCAMFVSWVLDNAGIKGFKHAYTPTGVEMFKKAGRWIDVSKKAEPGDVVYFDFPDSTFRVQHVGFVVRDLGGSVSTIEGNTSVSSDDNGGEVQNRTRTKSLIVGYGRPPYKTSRYAVVARKVIEGGKRAKETAKRLRKRGFKVKRTRR